MVKTKYKQQDELVYGYIDGNRSVEELLTQFEPYIITLSAEQEDPESCEQILKISLIKILESYNRERGRPTSYITTCLKRKLYDIHRARGHRIKLVFSLDTIDELTNESLRYDYDPIRTIELKHIGSILSSMEVQSKANILQDNCLKSYVEEHYGNQITQGD